MKKLVALTTTALLAASLLFGGTAASAADGGTIYPEDKDFIRTLTLSSLTDYAVEDEVYAFAEGKTVKKYDDGEYFEYGFETAVTDVDIKDGVIYCGCADEKVYTLPTQAECEYTFSQKVNRKEVGDFYYNIYNGKMYVSNLLKPETAPVAYDGEYSNIKKFGERVYAMNGNTLSEFSVSEEGEITCNEVVLQYADYLATHQILIGQASTKLKSYEEVKFLSIKEGSFMTAVNLEILNGQYFVPITTVRAGEDTKALLLCYSGNAAIVSIGEHSYILLKANTQELEVNYSTEKPFETAQLTNNMIYASPYVVSGTASSSNAMSLVVTVLDRIEYDGVLDTAFYEVEYTEGNVSVKGYVTEGFLTPYIAEDNKKPQEIIDPNYSESNDTKTILIIFAVVVLVLAVFAYVAHLSSNKKRKKSKKKDKGDDD